MYIWTIHVQYNIYILNKPFTPVRERTVRVHMYIEMCVEFKFIEQKGNMYIVHVYTYISSEAGKNA